jgi:hypothetical protein
MQNLLRNIAFGVGIRNKKSIIYIHVHKGYRAASRGLFKIETSPLKKGLEICKKESTIQKQ